jgi:hypothetical protein
MKITQDLRDFYFLLEYWYRHLIPSKYVNTCNEVVHQMLMDSRIARKMSWKITNSLQAGVSKKEDIFESYRLSKLLSYLRARLCLVLLLVKRLLVLSTKVV